MHLYAHPFSSYCQKVLIALYENAIPFESRLLTPGEERAAAEHAALWPLKRMPVLVDDGARSSKRASSSSISACITPGRCG
jgi:glutathione S-transferase